MSRAKLSAAEVREIRAAQRLRKTLTNKSLAAKYGVGTTTIADVLNRRRYWRVVDEGRVGYLVRNNRGPK